MRHFFLPTILLLAIIIPSCKKPASPAVTLAPNATIVNSGEIAADGCGWLVRLNDSTEFSPVNLSADFQQDNLKVNITYAQLSTRTSCGMLAGNPGILQIKINNIQKAN
jgi:hypothetical protein